MANFLYLFFFCLLSRISIPYWCFFQTSCILPINMNTKCLLILLDGLGDRSHAQFGHLTPLQAADTPVLDHLAAMGANGLYHAASLGQALPSENAHFSMFGYDLGEFPGRGALEAIGAGIPLGWTDVAILAHFACLAEENRRLILEQGKPQATDDEATSLFEAVDTHHCNGIDVRFHRTHALYGILTLRGEVSPFVTDTDPFIDGRPLSEPLPWLSHGNDKAAIDTAKALKTYLTWAWKMLAHHPVNQHRRQTNQPALTGIVTQRAGQLKKVSSFSEKWGLLGLSMASGIVYKGLAEYLGLDFKRVVDTKQAGNDLADRIRMAHEALKDYDFIHVHTKTPDETAHTKDPEAKKRIIERLDKGIGQAIEPVLKDPEVLVIVTADHSTPSAGPLIHSGEPVPLTFIGEGIRRDLVKAFDEVNTASGALGTVRGKELMYLILNHLDRAKLHGVMDTPLDQPFWPGHYEPFSILE